MITRIWRGWTSRQNAAIYQDLLLTEIFPGIKARNIEGFRSISLLRRDIENEVEFATVMWFDSIEAVKAFAGPQYETAVVPPKARAVLARFDATSAHYDTVVAPQW
ncbi:antibiotic biosynthesis monooxygenase [Herbaspirillum sp. HC18]|nr:antibiotic biosynthesis monooxygenase [Herbaspirillum sp. HC18]